MSDDKDVKFKVTGVFTTEGDGGVKTAIAGIGDEAEKAGKKASDAVGPSLREKMDKLRGQALLVGAAFGGGLSTGMKIAKLAGVDFTETTEMITKATKALAEGIDVGLTKSMG